MGGTPPRTPLEEALIKDVSLRTAIFIAARKRARTKEQAEDFSQDAQLKAILRARETGEPVPPGFRAFLLFVGSFLNTAAANQRRGDKRHPQVDMDVADPKNVTAATPDADAWFRARYDDDQVERVMTGIRQELEGEATPLAMLDKAEQDGLHKNADLAAAIGLPQPEIEKARRRILTVGKQVHERVFGAGGTAS